MGRTLRLHHPGCAFHIVSRTQGHLPWFTDDIKDSIAELLLRGTVSVGAKPVAFAVMDNHIHLILFQGTASLGWTMQPILQRIALLVQRKHRLMGHVFERRFRAKLCEDTEHLPNAILYVHRNPIEAKICRKACEYRWSSASHYAALVPAGFVAVDDGLQAFDPGGSASTEQRRVAYEERLNARRVDDEDSYWDWFWRATRRLRNSARNVSRSPHRDRRELRDVRDVALRILQSIDPCVDADLIRSRYGNQQVALIRHQLIVALIQRGYSGVAIAKFLRISEATVSRIRASMRWGSLLNA